MDHKFLDAEGIKYLWSKISMEDYPNNETLVAIINAIDETKANKSDIVNADWNATEDELGFILNKPEEITPDDVLELLAECNIINLAVADNNSILVDENGNVLLV